MPHMTQRDKERGARALGAGALCFLADDGIAWRRFVRYMHKEFPDTATTDLVSHGERSRFVCAALSMVLAEGLNDDEMTVTQDDYDQERPTTL